MQYPIGHSADTARSNGGHMDSHDSLHAHLREALTYLYDPHFLQSSPLLEQWGLDRQPDAPAVLRDTLVAEIEALKPMGAVPAQTREWRIYELLFYRYVQQFGQQEVADQLGLSVRHLRREQTIALDALGDRLKHRYKLTSLPLEVEQEAATPASAQPLDEELGWLRNSPPEKLTDLNSEIPAVLLLLQQLARLHHVEIELKMCQGLVEAAVHPVAVRQMLLSIVNSSINCPSVRHIVITVHRQGADVVIRVRCVAQGCAELRPDEGGMLTVAGIARLCGCALHVTPSGQGMEAALVLPALGQVPVMVIDDNPDTLDLLQRYVMGTRYRVIGVREPGNATQAAEEAAPHLIMLDIMMPQIDGWEVMGQLLHHPKTSHIPVLICSIVAQEELALSLGARGFVRKPVSRQSLLTALAQHLPMAEPRFA